ncbi:MAG: D-sedoheptulose 7-phosphate isomerase [Deltaproteobacteria bacterium]|nr:D-sedoheptulose 7-phosphate isomerase [Deltaproteobacteria bacterium]
MLDRARLAFREGAKTLAAFGDQCAPELCRLVEAVAQSLRAGGKVLVFGNGGSAADAQHLAAELVNRFRVDRPPLAGIALTTDTSALTAIGNDFGFERVFEKQVVALARPGDVVIGITTSGTSPNVVAGLRAARLRGCTCVGLTGEKGVSLGEACDFLFPVPSAETPRIQECHVAWIHGFCDLLDATLFPEAGAAG